MQQVVQLSRTRVYGAACTQPLGMERVKKLITIYVNFRQATENDFAVSLAVVDRDIQL
jgi:hypothetical protein